MGLRKRLIIDKPFQYSFILRNLALLLLAFALIFVTIKLWEKYQASLGFFLKPPPNSEIMDWARTNNVSVDSAEFARAIIGKAKVYTVFDLLWKPIAAVLVINVIILIIANVYYSHRIVGPIYRMKMLLEKKLKGETIDPIQFRKNDAFQELADVVNRALSLEKKDNKG